jgi:hypothetical protein
MIKRSLFTQQTEPVGSVKDAGFFMTRDPVVPNIFLRTLRAGMCAVR